MNPNVELLKKIRSFEDLLISINSFGLWQILIVLFTIYAKFFIGMTALSVLFYKITPEFACEIPAFSNEVDWNLEQIRNFSSPLKSDGDRDRCKIYDMNFTEYISTNYSKSLEDMAHFLNETPVIPCQDWLYDRSAMAETIVSKWDLVCDNKWMVEHGISLNFFGHLVGSVLSGFISDRFGRKKAFMLSIALMFFSGIVLGFVPSYIGFMIVSFFMLVGTKSAALAICCYTLEAMAGKARTWIGGLFFIPSAVSYSMVAAVAYLTRDYATLIHICCAPSLLIVILYCTSRYDSAEFEEGKKVLINVARINGRKLPDIDFREISADASKNTSRISFFRIFKFRVLVWRTLVIWLQWTLNAMVYYGLALNVSSFSGNIFLNNAIAGAPVEIPACVLATLLLHLGRKPATYLPLFFAGFCLIVVAWIPTDLNWLKLSVILAGKLGATLSFSVIYVHASEMYPTVVRNSGISAAAAVSRFGSMSAPYVDGISKMGKAYQSVPLTIFGVVSVVAALVTFALPETLGCKMPEQLEDALILNRESESRHSQSNVIS